MPTLRDRLTAARVAWKSGAPSSASPSAAAGRPTWRPIAATPTKALPRRLRRSRPTPAGLGSFPVDLRPDNWQRVTAIASLLSVLAVGAGLLVTNNYNRDQERLAEQGQITDRFTKAVEQLGQFGPEKTDVRLGSIYALQRIMRDSADDQPAVVDILAAFVRVHAPRPEPSDGPYSDTPSAPPPVDIQAALTVLARRDPARDFEGDHLSLTRTSLINADLHRAGFNHADLQHADLRGADLRGADLRDANLLYADLRHADLRGADLRGADLRGAELNGADLNEADMRNAKLVFEDQNDSNR
ncbi:pentapeptide repeat-containing protein [Micromonospora chersina]|uniref:pentapeptide repeat-containing protein n=1 Tax=Micromonospora chersina TaxID=47854 RepID=UPI0033F638B6